MSVAFVLASDTRCVALDMREATMEEKQQRVEAGISPENKITLYLSRDCELRKLYFEHPYFIDVLHWMNGELEFSKIRHFYTEMQFISNVLSSLQAKMLRLGLLAMHEGRFVTKFSSYEIRETPTGVASSLLLADHLHQAVIRRVGCGLASLGIETVRLRANREKITEWQKEIERIFSQLKLGQEDAAGELVTLSTFITIGD